MGIVEELEDAVLKSMLDNEFIDRSIPNLMRKMDNEFNTILEKYRLLQQNQRQIVQSSIPEEVGWILTGFSGRMATYALRFSNQDYFTNGLVALSLAWKVIDHRDIMLLMP